MRGATPALPAGGDGARLRNALQPASGLSSPSTSRPVVDLPAAGFADETERSARCGSASDTPSTACTAAARPNRPRSHASKSADQFACLEQRRVHSACRHQRRRTARIAGRACTPPSGTAPAGTMPESPRRSGPRHAGSAARRRSRAASRTDRARRPGSRQPPPRPVHDRRQRASKPVRVGMRRVGEQMRPPAPPRRCARHTSRRRRSQVLGDDAEIMADQHQRHAASRRRSRISRSRICAWIVTSSAVVGSSATSNFGLAGQRHGDHHALVLPAGEFMRIGVDSRRAASGMPTRSSRRLASARAAAPRQAAMQAQRLANLRAEAMHRVQAAGRVLEDHGDAAAANAVERGRRRGQNVPARRA